MGRYYKEQDKLARDNFNSAISETVSMCSKHGITLEIPDTGSMSLYRLEDLCTRILNIAEKKLFLKNKYKDDECLDKIMQEIPWLGMSTENLKDIKGEPASYEVSENTRTKTEILLYGANKWSGDVFTFKNGILTEFKDR
jgi:hypothetical protein